MASVEHISDFRVYRDQHLLNTPPGGEAFHGQLFPKRYASDIRAAAERRARGLEPEVPQEYLDFETAVIGRAARLNRLIVLHGPDEEGYDPTRFEEITRLLRPVHQRGERLRVGWYGKLASALIDICGEDSPYISGYLQGVEHNQSAYSFWSIRGADDQLEEIWPMSYGPNGELVTTPVHERPFDAADESLLCFEGFWHDAFHDPDLSVPLYD